MIYQIQFVGLKSLRRSKSTSPFLLQGKGQQTLKQLMEQNTGVSSIEINNDNIKDFEATVKKYGIDFALKKDATENPPRYIVFFKGKDADVMTEAFREYMNKNLAKIILSFAEMEKRRKDKTIKNRHL